MIFLFFKPLKLEEQKFVKVPQIEVKKFTMYEFTQSGLKTYMIASTALKYDDKFIIRNLDYTDKSPEYIANMRADEGVYKDGKIILKKNVFYTRDDGFDFQTQELVYDQNSSQAVSDVGYIAHIGKNVVKGTFIRYNTKSNRIYSKKIDAIYQLEERE